MFSRACCARASCFSHSPGAQPQERMTEPTEVADPLSASMMVRGVQGGQCSRCVCVSLQEETDPRTRALLPQCLSCPSPFYLTPPQADAVLDAASPGGGEEATSASQVRGAQGVACGRRLSFPFCVPPPPKKLNALSLSPSPPRTPHSRPRRQPLLPAPPVTRPAMVRVTHQAAPA